MHNNIMAAGSKDRPPMLGPGRYSQSIYAHEAAENILPVDAHEEAETIHNMTAENKLYFQAEKEAIFLILTGIGDEIYSTVDACNTSKEMWTAIERLQQGESLNVQDVKTNLFWEFGKFTSRDGESMESYYSRFYKLMNELTRNNLQVSPMQVNVQFLQQLQPEWSRFVTVVKQRQEIEVNDIRSERLARSANPLALLTAAQPYSKNSKFGFFGFGLFEISHWEGILENYTWTWAYPEEETGQRLRDLRQTISLRFVLIGWRCVLEYFYVDARHNCKVQEVQSSVTSSGDETSSGIVSDEEIDKKELEAHYGFMAKIQEVLPAESSSTDTPLEQVQNNDENNVFANERTPSEKKCLQECVDGAFKYCAFNFNCKFNS
ncbi:hypothetical protein Tco_0525615 [Tanacetum coccineum]